MGSMSCLMCVLKTKLLTLEEQFLLLALSQLASPLNILY